MALIKLGGLITQISGKLGGVSFATASNGSYVKNIGTYINKRTEKRTKANALFSTIANSWRFLNSGNIATWNTLNVNFPYTNRLGDTAYLSGYALYLKFSTNLALMGKALNPDCETPKTLVAPTLFKLTGDATKLYVECTGCDNACLYFLYVTPSLSFGNDTFKKQLRLIAILSKTQLNASYEYTGEWEAIFGPYVQGIKIGGAIKTVNESTGQQINEMMFSIGHT